MKLYLIRHGETDWNKQRRVQGHADIPLNEYGRFLAKETKKGLREVTFHLAYTSPLIRARETAEIVLGQRNTRLVEDGRIMEIGFGEAEGMCCVEPEKTPESKEFQKFFTDPQRYCVPKGGESFAQLRQRIGSFLEELYQKKEYSNKNVLVSTHGAAVTEMLNLIKGKTKIEEFWENGVPKNCAVSLVEVQGGVARVLEEGKVYY